jgi:hypothetical protein
MLKRLAAALLVAGLLAPALPARAEDVELQGVCGDRGDHVEYWAEAKRRHSDQGTLYVRIYRPGADVAGDSDGQPDRETDNRTGSAMPGESAPQGRVNVWRVPTPQRNDPAFGRKLRRVDKPDRNSKYFIEVKFQAPDAFITLSHDCE